MRWFTRRLAAAALAALALLLTTGCSELPWTVTHPDTPGYCHGGCPGTPPPASHTVDITTACVQVTGQAQVCK